LHAQLSLAAILFPMCSEWCRIMMWNVYMTEAIDNTTQRDISPTRRPLVDKWVKTSNIICDSLTCHYVINIKYQSTE